MAGGSRSRGQEARHRRHARRSLSGPLAIGVIFMIAGLLFAASANMGKNRDDRSSSLRELVAGQKTRQDQLSQELDALGARRDELLRQQDSGGISVPSPAPGDQIAAGTTPVSGPGLRVKLDDAPPGGLKPAGVRPDDLVVHQSDIEAVLDALWQGGAEAIAIQGQRLGVTSAVRCVGNVLLVGGQVYSPPYVIDAIGPHDQMRAALEASREIQDYLQWVQYVGLGWDVTNSSQLDLPKFDGASEPLRYAQVVPAS